VESNIKCAHFAQVSLTPGTPHARGRAEAPGLRARHKGDRASKAERNAGTDAHMQTHTHSQTHTQPHTHTPATPTHTHL
jgi:hypothetical protein